MEKLTELPVVLQLWDDSWPTSELDMASFKLTIVTWDSMDDIGCEVVIDCGIH